MNTATKHHCKAALRLPKTHQLIIGLALSLSIGLISTQRIFNTTLKSTLTEQSSALLTAEIEIASTKPLSATNITAINQALPSHNVAERRVFSSMIQYYGNSSKLVEIFAIDNNYPLIGDCLAMDATGNERPIQTFMQDGEQSIVISQELANQTDITYGTFLSIGEYTGTVTGIITKEPDINIQSLAYGPRIYMPLSDTQATGFKNDRTRKYHSRFIELTAPGDIQQLTQTLTGALAIEGTQKTIQGSYGPSQPIIVRNFRDINKDIIRGFDALNQFFLFLSLFVLMLTGIAFGFMIWTSIIQALPMIGNLRYMGLSTRNIHQFYMSESLQLAIKMTAAGLAIGATLAQIAMSIVANRMNISFQWIQLSITDIGLVVGFSVIAILGITKVVLSIINANRNFHGEQSNISMVKLWAIIFAGLIGFLSLFLALNGLGITAIAILIALFALIFSGLYGLDVGIGAALRRVRVPGSIELRLAINHLSESHTLRRVAFISITFAMITILTIANYQTSLDNEFSPKNPDQVLPSLFVIDIYDQQLNKFNNMVDGTAHYGAVIRTRISKINDQAASIYAKTAELNDPYFLYREQNLSTRNDLYPSEQVVAGSWFTANDDTIEMSVEERFAKRLKLNLGDTIEFNFLMITFKATITSIRSVDWSTFKPNFFMIIEAPHLDPLPKTHVSAITLTDPSQKDATIGKLSQTFANISIIDIQKTSQKIISFLKGILIAIHSGAIYCFLIGLLLYALLGKLFTDIRRSNLNRLYWIGLSFKQINRMALIETLAFSSIIFLTAWGISTGICWVLFEFFVPIALAINGWFAIALWVILTLIVLVHNQLQQPFKLEGAGDD